MSSHDPSTVPLLATGQVSPSASSPSEKGDPADVLPWLPCTVSLDIPLSRFTIGDLSRLKKGSVLTTSYRHLSDIPLYVNGQFIGWTEFEVIDECLAVRITELA